MQYLEQAFNQNTVASNDENQSNFIQPQYSSLILDYYQELGHMMVQDKKISQAIDCYQKALKVSQGYHGEEHFVTFECLLNLGELLDESGEKQQAQELFKQCLINFQKKDMVKGQEINDQLDEISFASDNVNSGNI